MSFPSFFRVGRAIVLLTLCAVVSRGQSAANDPRAAAAEAMVPVIIEAVNAGNLRLQFDVYHTHIMEGDVVSAIHRNLRHIEHIQIADDPGRHEPGTGRIDFASIFQTLERANYDGFIGCEYVPSKTTEESLMWLRNPRQHDTQEHPSITTPFEEH